MSNNSKYPLISVIFITFNRYDLLKRTLYNLKNKCNYPNLELIICDDASPNYVQNKILALPFDKYLLSKKNQGLGANTNKGLKSASGEYILQLQDDWDFIGNKNMLKNSIELLEKDKKIDLIRYYNTTKYPQKVKYQNNKYFEVDFSILSNDEHNTLYSDTPHLKRKEFHLKYGYFKENVPMTKMEIEFAKNYANNRMGKVVFTTTDQFIHTGENVSFNPYQIRKKKIHNMRMNPFLYFLFSSYNYLKGILKRFIQL